MVDNISSEQSTKSEPIQKAIKEFLQRRPRYWQSTNEHIAKAFSRLYQQDKPLEIQIREDVYQIFSDRTHEYIYCKVSPSPNKKKRKSGEYSITKSIFLQDYIPEAINRVHPDNEYS